LNFTTFDLNYKTHVNLSIHCGGIENKYLKDILYDAVCYTYMLLKLSIEV